MYTHGLSNCMQIVCLQDRNTSKGQITAYEMESDLLKG